MPYVPHDLDGNVVEGDFDNRDVVSLLKKLGYRHEGFTRGIDLGLICNLLTLAFSCKSFRYASENI